jgi:hypothetical protein
MCSFGAGMSIDVFDDGSTTYFTTFADGGGAEGARALADAAIWTSGSFFEQPVEMSNDPAKITRVVRTDMAFASTRST